MMNPVIVDSYHQWSDKPHCVWNCDEIDRNFEHTPVRVIFDKKAQDVVGKNKQQQNKYHYHVRKCKRDKYAFHVHRQLLFTGLIPRHRQDLFKRMTKWMTRSEKNGSRAFSWEKNLWPRETTAFNFRWPLFSLAILYCTMENQIQILSVPPHTTHIL